MRKSIYYVLGGIEYKLRETIYGENGEGMKEMVFTTPHGKIEYRISVRDNRPYGLPITKGIKYKKVIK